MPRQLNVESLRPETPVLLTGRKIVLKHDLNETLRNAGIQIANISGMFRDYYVNCWTRAQGSETLYRCTVRHPMPGDLLKAFTFWSGVLLVDFLSTIAIQGDGQEGSLLNNGKLNGCVLRENPEWSMTARWHDPLRPYSEQTAVFPKLGWSLHAVPTRNRGWCPQGGMILFTCD